MIFLFKRKLSLQTEEVSRVNPTAHPVIGFSPYDSELATFTMHVSSLSRTFVEKVFIHEKHKHVQGTTLSMLN